MNTRRAAVAILLLAGCAATVAAQPTRKSVTVNRPADLPRRAADIAADGLARKAFVETLINERMSPVLLQFRRDDIRTALEPLDALLDKFAVVSREPLDGNRERLVVEADVDLGAVLLRLVTAKVLAIAPEAPRILLLPGPGTSLETVKGIRARVRETLATAGITLLAVEEVAQRFVPAPATAQGLSAMTRQVSETRADLLAVVTARSQQAPSSVGGVVLDATLQFTVVRPRDNTILAEQTFTTRGAGATRLLADEAVLNELGPQMGRALGSQLCTAIFASADIIEPSAMLQRAITINVFYRPAGSTMALVEYLVGKNLKVRLGSSALVAADGEVRNRVGDPAFAAKRPAPVDRLIAEGDVALEDLYVFLTDAKFGPAKAYSASVIEYGDSYIGLEIVDGRTPPKAPKVSVAPPREAVVKAAAVAAATAPAGPRPPLQLHKKIG